MKLHLGDNLEVLSTMDTESVDMIYLDPPFFSQANYDTFNDTWSWNANAEAGVKLLRGPVAKTIEGLLFFVGNTSLASYLVMMGARLPLLHAVLRSTGTLYLHCDPSASHYLKVLLDSIFGYDNFLGETIWYYRGAGIPKTTRAKRHDVLLVYAKRLGDHVFNPDPIRQPYSAETIKRFKGKVGNVRGGLDFGSQSLHPLGKHPDDVISHIQPIAPSAKERIGYPTQKPLQLLEEIIASSTNLGDMVLDPFCGSGTTLLAAKRLGRDWIGIDKSPEAIDVCEVRLDD